MSKGSQIALGAGVVAVLLGWYAASNRDALATFQYYKTPSEFQASGATGKQARVHGYVAIGSIARDVAGGTVRFTVQEEPPHASERVEPAMTVVYGSLEVPDLFKDGAEVVVEGRLEHDGPEAVFLAENVLAKCPSKFEAMRTEEASF